MSIGEIMGNFNKSEAFKRLEKLADLEKIVSGRIESAKDTDGDIDIPKPISDDLRLRGSCPLPQKILDDTIDDGLDATIAHLAKHKAMFLPGEALYHAIGIKDPSVYKSALNMTLGDILSMISNKAAVASEDAPSPMSLDDFDVPKHVKVIIRMRGMSPDMLEKSARDKIGTSDLLSSLEITYMNGRVEKIGKRSVSESKDLINKLINDGVIIKVVKLLSSGQKTTLYEKTASSGIDDMLYAEMLKGKHSV